MYYFENKCKVGINGVFLIKSRYCRWSTDNRAITIMIDHGNSDDLDLFYRECIKKTKDRKPFPHDIMVANKNIIIQFFKCEFVAQTVEQPSHPPPPAFVFNQRAFTHLFMYERTEILFLRRKSYFKLDNRLFNT